MSDVVGLHLGIHYEATYREQGDFATWSATLVRGNELLLAEGSVTTAGSGCSDIAVLVHLSVQRQIDELQQRVPDAPYRSRLYARGG